MPELPEVETTRRGIAAIAEGQFVRSVTCRTERLRLPLQANLSQTLSGKKICSLERRAKYLLFQLDIGVLVIHLGMSGHLRIVAPDTPHDRHDHVDIRLANDAVIRYHDPRKFGLVHFVEDPIEEHRLFRDLGLEPFAAEFNGDYLFRVAKGRRVAIKSLIMNQKVVVGVGNIYASEALFRARIHPNRPAGRISRQRYRRLADEIKTVLTAAIAAGGTTLRDFLDGSAKPGYFKNQLLVYGRAEQECRNCGRAIASVRIGQRSTFFCPHCQR